jgi:hypothetical protein
LSNKKVITLCKYVTYGNESISLGCKPLYGELSCVSWCVWLKSIHLYASEIKVFEFYFDLHPSKFTPLIEAQTEIYRVS